MYLLLVCADICHWLCGDQRKTRVCVCVCVCVCARVCACACVFCLSPLCASRGSVPVARLLGLTCWLTETPHPKTLAFKLVLIPPSDNVLLLFINFKLYLFILGQGLSVPSHSPSFAPPVPSCSAISRRDPRQTARVHTFLMGQPHLSHLYDQISTHRFHFRSIFFYLSICCEPNSYNCPGWLWTPWLQQFPCWAPFGNHNALLSHTSFKNKLLHFTFMPLAKVLWTK